MTGYETILGIALAALTIPSQVADQVRRAHKTAIPRELGGVDAAVAVHLVDGGDDPVSGSKCGDRECSFMTSIFVRSDDGVAAADGYRSEIFARFHTAVWPENVVVKPGRISMEEEVADEDAIRVDVEWSAFYRTGSIWSLELG